MMDSLKHTVDISAVVWLGGILMGMLPNFAAVLTVAWLAARLYNEVMLAVYKHRDRARTPTAQSVRLSDAPPSQE